VCVGGKSQVIVLNDGHCGETFLTSRGCSRAICSCML
jgi:hypothetical protein